METTAQGEKTCTSLFEDLIEFPYAVIHNPQHDIYFFKELYYSNEDLEKQCCNFLEVFAGEGLDVLQQLN